MENNSGKQARPYWLLLSLAIIVIIFGIVIICFPSIFGKFMDIILGIFLFTAGISAIINSFKNKDSQYTWILGIGGFLLTLLGFGLIFSWSQLVLTIMIWVFALWAFLRGILLIAFSIINKEKQSLWWAILGLGVLLLVLGIIIIVSPKDEVRSLVGICIGVSTVFDGVSLLIAALKLKNNPSLQNQVIDQANQNEISQGEVVITSTVVASQPQDNTVNPNPNNTPDNSGNTPDNNSTNS